MANIFGTKHYSNDDVDRLIAEAGDEEEVDFLAQAAAAAAAADTALITALKADTNTFTGTNTFSTKLLVGSATPSGEGEALSIEQIALVDSALNGTIGGENVYNQISYGVPGRKLYWAQGVDNTNLNYYLGYKNGGGPDPDYFLSIRTGVGMCIQPDTSLDPGNYTEALRVISKGANKALHIGGPSHFNGAITLESGTTLAGATGTEIARLSGVTSAIQTQIDTKAPLVAPAFSGVATFTSLPTCSGVPSADGELANKKYVDDEITGLIGGASGALDTLIELSNALGDDPNFATTMTNSLAAKAPLASPNFTGTIQTAQATSTQLGSVARTAKALLTVVNNSEISSSTTTAGTYGPMDVYTHMQFGERHMTWAQGTGANNIYTYFGSNGGGTPDPDFEYTFKRGTGLKISPSLDETTDVGAALHVIGTSIITGTATFDGLVTLNTTATAQYPTAWNHIATKQYADTKTSPAGANTWTGTNTYNTNLPTSTLTPTSGTQFVTKTYADSFANKAGVFFTPFSTDTLEESGCFPILHSATDMNDLFTHAEADDHALDNSERQDTGIAAKGYFKKLAIHERRGIYIVYPNYGIVVYNVAGWVPGASDVNVLINFKNTTSKIISVKAGGDFDTSRSIKIYFNGVEQT